MSLSGRSFNFTPTSDHADQLKESTLLVDLITIRENTEGEYSGLEHEVVLGVVENLKIISRLACENITNYAFEYAKNNGNFIINFR